MFDAEKRLSFPTADGRSLDLVVNLESGIARMVETLDGEEQIISTCTTEIKTLAYFIDSLEKERETKKKKIDVPFHEAM